MSDLPAPWYGGGLPFGCTSCGACCKGPQTGHVEVTAEEVTALAAYLELSAAAFGRRYLRRLADGRLSLVERANNDCCFWEDVGGCAVYRVRPAQCRQYPFWPEFLATREAWQGEATSCPGIGVGRTYSRAEIERISAGKRGTRPGRRPRLPSASD